MSKRYQSQPDANFDANFFCANFDANFFGSLRLLFSKS